MEVLKLVALRCSDKIVDGRHCTMAKHMGCNGEDAMVKKKRQKLNQVYEKRWQGERGKVLEAEVNRYDDEQ